MTFLFKTEPYAHQRTALELSADADYFALLMEMRTGKSKVIIDNTSYLYSQGKINALVVIAPNGVHRNWVVNEVTAHLPDEVHRIAVFWRSGMTKAQEREWNTLYSEDSIPLRIAVMSYDAIITPKGKMALKKLLTTFDCMLVADESHRMKTPGAKRTKVMMAAAPYAKYRRILTGTSITQGPLDLYSQFKFLDPYITGFQTFTAFRAHFAEIEQRRTNNNRRGFFEQVVGYKNIDQLQHAIAPHSIVVRADDCEDMPEKVYKTIYTELTPKQKRIYVDLLENAMAELTEAAPDIPEGLSHTEMILWMLTQGDKVRADNALTKLLRLQQVLGGYVPNESGEVQAIESNRLKTLMDALEDINGKVIIWARFRAELADIEDALREKHGEAAVVSYHGGVDSDARQEAVERFGNDDTCRYFVGNAQSGGIGLPLHAADTMLYYSCDFNLDTRLQSEERFRKVGKAGSVLVIDIVAPETVDEKILEALAMKRDTAESFYAGLNKL